MGNKNETRIMQVSDIRCKGRRGVIPRGAGPLANRHPRFPESNVNYLLLCSSERPSIVNLFTNKIPLYPLFLSLSLSLSFVRKCQVDTKMFSGEEEARRANIVY